MIGRGTKIATRIYPKGKNRDKQLRWQKQKQGPKTKQRIIKKNRDSQLAKIEENRAQKEGRNRRSRTQKTRTAGRGRWLQKTEIRGLLCD